MSEPHLVVISARMDCEPTGQAFRSAITTLGPLSDALHLASRPISGLADDERQALVDVLAEGNSKAYVFEGLADEF